MKRFNDIKQEVCVPTEIHNPVRHYQPDNPLDAKQDAFMRLYRNFWGAYTDTQIRALNATDYIITGRYCNEPMYMQRVFSSNPIGHNLVVPATMADILIGMGFCAKYVRYNGQIAILLTTRRENENVLNLFDTNLFHEVIPDITHCTCSR